MNSKTRKNAIKTAFDEASYGYDSASLRFFDSAAMYLSNITSLSGNECVLDIATGTGKIAICLAKSLPYGHVVGIDISEGMVLRAINNAKNSGQENIKFLNEDIEIICFENEKYDHVFCGFGISFFSDQGAVIKKSFDSLKRGGSITLSNFTARSFSPFDDIFISRLRSYDIDIPESSRKSEDYPEQVSGILRAAGFENIETLYKNFGYHLYSFGEWWDCLWNSGYRVFLNLLSSSDMDRFKNEHLHDIKPYIQKNGIFIDVEVVVSRGYKFT